MTANLIDLRQGREAAPDYLPGLQAYLAQLVGEPFRFARVSYGDELTLHFGDLRPARSPKLKDRLYGTYILGVRASPWVLKAGNAPMVVAAGIDLDETASGFGRPVRKEDLEGNPPIQPDSRVLSALPFAVKPANGFGLQIRFSDGSAIHILPAPSDAEEGGASEDEALPELADWEVISPSGLLSAGPGLIWSFKPSSGTGTRLGQSCPDADADVAGG